MGQDGAMVEKNSVKGALVIEKQNPNDRVIALAGNPNVGKSTVFNGLTGMHQHTGNWAGKTVANAWGRVEQEGKGYILVDIPGAYSLHPSSAEEEVAADYICFGQPDAAIVVCDATNLERNLNLALQIAEVTPKTVLCVNLLDEARKKKIAVDLEKLSQITGLVVAGTEARSKKGLEELISAVQTALEDPDDASAPCLVTYPPVVEEMLSVLLPAAQGLAGVHFSSRWLALKILENDQNVLEKISAALGRDLFDDPYLQDALQKIKTIKRKENYTDDRLRDDIATAAVQKAQQINRKVTTYHNPNYSARDRKIDRLLTSKKTGYPVMLALLGVVFWLSIVGANYPSMWLSSAFSWAEGKLAAVFTYFGAPAGVQGALVEGAFRTLGWIVSVMLPPMAIFFPLFTLLEDLGYLPRVAFNLDRNFRRCGACGKQALTMCMGFGCNAAGVVGCRIIDSPRERLIAILTNNFVPCNGRFAPFW